MKYHIITYGCQMNEADSGLMGDLLSACGWEACAGVEEADLIVLNTCSVREKPEQKVYSRLGRLAKLKEANPGLVIAVAGCMAQREGKEIRRRAPYVNLVLGTRQFHHLPELVERVRAGERGLVQLDGEEDPSAARGRPESEQRTAPLRAFVPIIRGCSNFCSYCIVPYVRGREVSRPLRDIVCEVRGLADRGAREVTLLGQNVLAYGRDLADGPSFADLLREVDGMEGLWRIRFTTCHPRDVTDELVEAMAGLPTVCEHIHLPIQAGADRVLDEMRRGYTTRDYLDTVARLRSAVGGLAITTDMMVGFPGETEEEFEESLRLYERIGFDAAFMFAYSPRPGTAAAAREDQVPRRTKSARLQRLIALQNGLTIARNEAEVGREMEALVEGPAERGEGLLAGRARNNKLVIFPGGAELAGSLVRVRSTEAHLWGFRGEIAVS